MTYRELVKVARETEQSICKDVAQGFKPFPRMDRAMNKLIHEECILDCLAHDWDWDWEAEAIPEAARAFYGIVPAM